ncbi:MAG TPA: hypothetical protein VKP61_08755 [Candidatus Acidoferrum sp.]|nr:hypothetical protein [Candidatus Acidoferrum sp.]
MSLTLERIERLAADEKEDWQRKVNQGVLKDDRIQQLMAMGGMEAVEKFLYVLRLEFQRIENPTRLRAVRK